MKFKVGDSVEIVRAMDEEAEEFIGKTGIIAHVAVYDDDYYSVELDNGDWIEFFEEEMELA
jgi:hypothetical protein